MSPQVVVFDGECSLCNGFVAWLIRHDRDAAFRVAGSAGPVGAAVIERAGLPKNIGDSSIVLWDGTRARTQSDAVLAIVAALPWPWKAIRVARIVPPPLRDRVYRFVAARRARINAEDPACGVPPGDLVETWRSRLATSNDVG